MFKKAPQMASSWPSWPQLGSSWRHLGSNLAPGAILPQLGEILVDPSPAKIDQNQPRQLVRDFLSQGRPQELPDPLQTSIFQVFKSIFSKVFVNSSEHLFIDSALKFTAFLTPFFLFFHSVPLERSRRERGRRYSPAGRLRYVLLL